MRFKYVKMRNFRSIGNEYITIDLTKKSNLITSDNNGNGKSSILNFSLCYVLFGDHFNGSKIGNLINDKNGRCLEVETSFFTKGKDYVVKRHMKPDLFEIYENGKLIEQTAHKNDYQKLLDEIIGVHKKIFFNNILINQQRFVPFVQMTAAERRLYVEELLNLNIISRMAELNKQDVSIKEKEIETKNKEKETLDHKINSSVKLIVALKETKASRDILLDKKKDELTKEIDVFSTKIEAEKKKIKEYKENDKIEPWIEKNTKVLYNYKASIESINKEIREKRLKVNKLQNEKICYVCGSGMSPEHAKKHIDSLFEEINNHLKELDEVKSKEEKLSKDIERGKDILYQTKTIKETNQKIKNNIDIYTNSISDRQKQIKDVENEKLKKDTSDESIEKESVVLLSYQKSREQLETLLTYLYKELTILKKVRDNLKDTGLKKTLIDQYMPLLNQKTNEYLSEMGFYFYVDVKSNFDIELNSSIRKNLRIEDLSSGQNRRIDLAIMLAWHYIGSLLDSLDTNILILDETLESLSASGVSEFIDFFNRKFPEKNLFVITQRNDEFQQHFDNNIHLYLDNEGYTTIKT